MPKPGRMTTSTPMKPTTIASQRRMPTRSARKKCAMAVISSGSMKATACASASGT
jgi:hypothetical protein